MYDKYTSDKEITGSYHLKLAWYAPIGFFFFCMLFVSLTLAQVS